MKVWLCFVALALSVVPVVAVSCEPSKTDRENLEDVLEQYEIQIRHRQYVSMSKQLPPRMRSMMADDAGVDIRTCLLYTSPSPRDS